MQINKIFYDIKIYPNSNNNNERYILGMLGKRPLIIIGLNPSIANDKEPDMTMKKVIGFAERNNHDSFIMLNLYPQRTKHPNNLHTTLNSNLHKTNVNHIIELFGSYNNATILAAWGGKILIRPFLKNCLAEIVSSTSSLRIKWQKIGDLTKSGHPRHPSRASYELGLTDFDIIGYQNTNKAK
jgi:hypothetical protein